MKLHSKGKLKLLVTLAIMSIAFTAGTNIATAADMSHGANNFYKSDKVNTEIVKFKNIYGMEVTGTLFTPRNMAAGKKYDALIVGHPFAAVRQQAANLYATKMAEAGFVTLSFDQSFWGESAGTPRGAVLPDVYAENFSAAVDFLGTRTFVDRDKIGVIGICGSGGFAIAATKVDPRIKALATVSMYDMGEYFRTGLNHERTAAMRNKDLATAAEQRYKTFKTGQPVYGPGQNDPVFIEGKESNDFYQTERGKVASNDRRTTPATYARLMNFHPFIDIESISPRPILFIVGDAAPSRTYTDTAYKMAAEPKELMEIKGANRIDLYDRTELIPWDKLVSFFNTNLNTNK
ncbi:alpha/beta hydrolase [Enterobacter sp. RHBSTW-00175]|uniref:alpha/beta hydrolase n=1 Tax=Enterobacter sp. RHBSTW-00175 TaxID=2742639 RepID=UPI0015E9CC43|nr:alpha/beta hydrolase [Enterobacter sp. RHBSTW-00175]QMR78242.1 alpha/beta hydrolase [Enterobacter sp. RHBSTW-00175]